MLLVLLLASLAGHLCYEWMPPKPGLCYSQSHQGVVSMPPYHFSVVDAMQACQHSCEVESECEAYSATKSGGVVLCLLHPSAAVLQGLALGTLDSGSFHFQSPGIGFGLPKTKPIMLASANTTMGTVPNSWCRLFGSYRTIGEWQHITSFTLLGAWQQITSFNLLDMHYSADSRRILSFNLIFNNTLNVATASRTTVFDLVLGQEDPEWACFSGSVGFSENYVAWVNTSTPNALHMKNIKTSAIIVQNNVTQNATGNQGSDYTSIPLDNGNLTVQAWLPLSITISPLERYIIYCQVDVHGRDKRGFVMTISGEVLFIFIQSAAISLPQSDLFYFGDGENSILAGTFGGPEQANGPPHDDRLLRFINFDVSTKNVTYTDCQLVLYSKGELYYCLTDDYGPSINGWPWPIYVSRYNFSDPSRGNVGVTLQIIANVSAWDPGNLTEAWFSRGPETDDVLPLTISEDGNIIWGIVTTHVDGKSSSILRCTAPSSIWEPIVQMDKQCARCAPVILAMSDKWFIMIVKLCDLYDFCEATRIMYTLQKEVDLSWEPPWKNIDFGPIQQVQFLSENTIIVRGASVTAIYDLTSDSNHVPVWHGHDGVMLRVSSNRETFAIAQRPGFLSEEDRTYYGSRLSAFRTEATSPDTYSGLCIASPQSFNCKNQIREEPYFPYPYHHFPLMTEGQCDKICTEEYDLVPSHKFLPGDCSAVSWIPALGCRVVTSETYSLDLNNLEHFVSIVMDPIHSWKGDAVRFPDFMCYSKGTGTPTRTPHTTGSTTDTSTATSTPTTMPTLTITPTASTVFDLCFATMTTARDKIVLSAVPPELRCIIPLPHPEISVSLDTFYKIYYVVTILGTPASQVITILNPETGQHDQTQVQDKEFGFWTKTNITNFKLFLRKDFRAESEEPSDPESITVIVEVVTEAALWIIGTITFLGVWTLIAAISILGGTLTAEMGEYQCFWRYRNLDFNLLSTNRGRNLIILLGSIILGMGAVCFAVAYACWNGLGAWPSSVAYSFLLFVVGLLAVVFSILWYHRIPRLPCPACNLPNSQFRFKAYNVSDKAEVRGKAKLLRLQVASPIVIKFAQRQRGIFHYKCALCVKCHQIVNNDAFPGSSNDRLYHNSCWESLLRHVGSNTLELVKWLQTEPGQAEIAHMAGWFILEHDLQSVRLVLKKDPSACNVSLNGYPERYLHTLAVGTGFTECIEDVFKITQGEPLDAPPTDPGVLVGFDIPSDTNRGQANSDVYLKHPFLTYNNQQIYRSCDFGRYLYYVPPAETEQESTASFHPNPSDLNPTDNTNAMDSGWTVSPMPGIVDDKANRPVIVGVGEDVRADQCVSAVDDPELVASGIRRQVCAVPCYAVDGSVLEKAIVLGNPEIVRLVIKEYKMRNSNFISWQYETDFGLWMKYPDWIQRELSKAFVQGERRVDIMAEGKGVLFKIDIVSMAQAMQGKKSVTRIRAALPFVLYSNKASNDAFASDMSIDSGDSPAPVKSVVFSGMRLATIAAEGHQKEVLKVLIDEGVTGPEEWIWHTDPTEILSGTMPPLMAEIYNKFVSRYLRHFGCTRYERHKKHPSGGRYRDSKTQSSLHTDGLSSPPTVLRPDQDSLSFYPMGYHPSVRVGPFIFSLTRVTQYNWKFTEDSIGTLIMDFSTRFQDIQLNHLKMQATDIFTLFTYTYEINDSLHQIYGELNRAMRAMSHDVGRQEIAFWRPFIWHMDQALAKLPPYEGNVFRGINISFETGYNEAAVVLWQSYSSSSYKRSVAEEFAVKAPEGQGQEQGPQQELQQEQEQSTTSTLFFLKATTARNISHYSAFPSEGEVIFLSNSRFKVELVLKGNTGIGKFYSRCDNIEMRELNRSWAEVQARQDYVRNLQPQSRVPKFFASIQNFDWIDRDRGHLEDSDTLLAYQSGIITLTHRNNLTALDEIFSPVLPPGRASTPTDEILTVQPNMSNSFVVADFIPEPVSFSFSGRRSLRRVSVSSSGPRLSRPVSFASSVNGRAGVISEELPARGGHDPVTQRDILPPHNESGPVNASAVHLDVNGMVRLNSVLESTESSNSIDSSSEESTPAEVVAPSSEGNASFVSLGGLGLMSDNLISSPVNMTHDIQASLQIPPGICTTGEDMPTSPLAKYRIT